MSELFSQLGKFALEHEVPFGEAAITERQKRSSLKGSGRVENSRLGAGDLADGGLGCGGGREQRPQEQQRRPHPHCSTTTMFDIGGCFLSLGSILERVRDTLLLSISLSLACSGRPKCGPVRTRAAAANSSR